jgi:hypothetical protein
MTTSNSTISLLRRSDDRPRCPVSHCRLLAAELLDLLELGLGQVVRHVVPGDLRALYVMPDVVDDLGVCQGSLPSTMGVCEACACRSTQLYDAFSLPPTNHFQNGGLLESSVVCHGWSQVSRSAGRPPCTPNSPGGADRRLASERRCGAPGVVTAGRYASSTDNSPATYCRVIEPAVLQRRVTAEWSRP